MKSKSINYIFRDKPLKNENGILSLKTKTGLKTFTDKGENTYSYLGQIKFLNAYVVLWGCGECEEAFWLLIDKATGKQILETNWGFPAEPQFSPNMKQIMCMSENLNGYTELNVYSYSKDSTTLFAYKAYGGWIPIGDGFWGNDNCYYSAVLPSPIAHSNEYNYEKRLKTKYNFRYVKIKIKGPTPKVEN